MKNLTSLFFAAVALAGSLFVPDSSSAQYPPAVTGNAGRYGHGHAIHGNFNRGYFPQKGPYGYGNYGYQDRWRSSGHWRYYPSGVYRQGTSYQYLPGHYEWQQQGNIYPKRDPYD